MTLHILPRFAFVAFTMAMVACGATTFGQNILVNTPGATTVQLPTFGVSVDAEGVLQMRTVEDPTGAQRAERIKHARQSLSSDLQARSPLRKVSLSRLERELVKCRTAGRSADDAMAHLAGLQNIRFAFLYPESGDVVIAGEAEGWLDDGLGRAIGLTSGRPVLRLVDLVTALRAFSSSANGPTFVGPTFVGCTIDPTTEGLQRLMQLKSQVPATIAEADRGPFAAELDRRTRESLGRASVRVFGIGADTHLAAVLVEADYRMKRTALGVEPAPVRLASYVDRTSGAASSPLQRYWFLPDYDRLQTDAERQCLEILGRGVRLQTEELSIGPGGAIAKGARPDPAAEAFCRDFTQQFDAISARSPVYAELRNMVDLLVTAAFMRREGWYDRAGWTPQALLDADAVISHDAAAPTSADVVVNTVWKGSRLVSAAGGGVSIQVDESLRPEHLKTAGGGHFRDPRQKLTPPQAGDRWWWD